MSKLTSILLILLSLPTFAQTQLECYQEFLPRGISLNNSAIRLYTSNFNEEELLLDQYYNPSKYSNGPHAPFRATEILSKIASSRMKIKESLAQYKELSQELNFELKACLKYASDNQ